MTTNTQMIAGSIGAIARQQGQAIAVSFISAEIIAVVDVSGSMDSHDARDHQSRYEVACQELATLQRQHPGEMAMVSFSNGAQFCPGGVPIYEGGGTDLTGALKFVKVADGTVRFMVISDGRPDNEETALAVARKFISRIDTVYVGPEGGNGADFLQQLSSVAGGQHVTTDVNLLCGQVERLMLTEHAD